MHNLPHLNVEQIPSELKAIPQWVCWRYETRKNQVTKVPYNANANLPQHARVNHPPTWAPFDTAVQAAKSGEFNGIGIVLTPDHSLVAFDIDHCKTPEGQWTPEALSLVKLLNSYCEITPSGQGLRVLCRGSLPGGRAGLRRGNYEVYGAKRYVTITGNRLEGAPASVEPRQKEIEEACQWIFNTGGGKTQGSAPARPSAPGGVPANFAKEEDRELLTRALEGKNGEKLQRLLNTQDGAGYRSSSEADLALASILLRECKGKVEQAKRIFSASCRGQREKWKTRKDYRDATFNRAQKGVSRPSEEEPLDSDYGHAQVLARLWRGQYRWATHRSAWMHNPGPLWRPAPKEEVKKHAADALIEEYTRQLNQNGLPRERMDELAKKIEQACNEKKVEKALEFLKGWEGILTPSDAWDTDHYLLNVMNGVLDLRTMTLRRHNPDDLITKMANTVYDPTAKGERWAEHIERILPDAEVRRQVQRDLGIALVGEALEESLPIWYGTGANGKTTTMRVLLNILGDYANRAAPNLLIQSKYERHPTEIADLAGLRLVFSMEVDQGKKLAEALVKELTGGDRKKGRYMRGDFFSFEQTFSLVLVTNHKPGVSGTDEGIWRRLKLIPFTTCIPEGERRPQEEVVNELTSEGAAILNWLLEGLCDWRNHRGWRANQVTCSTQAYRAEMDILKDFLDDMCEMSESKMTPKGELYKAYTQWCEANNERPISHKSFSQKLAEHDIGEFREGRQRTRMYVGVALSPKSKVTDT